MTEWNIQSRAHACTACGKSFSDKETYHTLLFDEKAEFRRSDVCQPCWEKQYSQGARDRKGFISYWQGVYQAPPPRTEAIQKENAESLLRKIIELNDPQYSSAAFILAVMLERKRLLKVKEQVVRDGRRVFIYEHPGTGDVFTVGDPNLQLDQLETVQRDVAALLEHGLPQVQPAAEGQPTPAPAQETSPAASETPEPPVAPAAPNAQGSPMAEAQVQPQSAIPVEPAVAVQDARPSPP